MTLRKKSITIIGLTFVCLTSILLIISFLITEGGFTGIENKEIRKDVERSLNVIKNEISRLDEIASDYATSDDTYAFISNGNKAYVYHNLSDTTFSRLKVNFILFIDTSGRIVFGKSFDLKMGGEVSFPKSLQKQLAGNAELTKHTDADQSVSGIMLFPDGPVIVSSFPIRNGEGLGPVRGTLIMGRNFDYFRIQQLARMTNLSLLMHRFNDEKLPPDMKEIKASLSAQTPVILKPMNEDIIAGYAFVKDIIGEPVLLLRVDQPRAVRKQEQSTLHYLLISLFTGTLVLSLVTLLLLEKNVLRRLTKLTEDVKQIALVGHFYKRVSQSGKDELGHLAFEINGMLEKLDAAEKFREETDKARYRAVVEDQTELICRYLPDGTINFVNGACIRYYGMERDHLTSLNFMFLNDEGYENFNSRIASLNPENSMITREHQIRKKDGQICWQQWTDRAIFDDNGQIVECQSVGSDITERKQGEEERLRLVAAVEQATDAIIVTDVEMNIRYVNPAFVLLSGFDKSELIGQHPRLLKSDKQNNYFYNDIRKTMEEGKVWSGRLINKRKNGSLYEVEATSSPIRNAKGNVINYVGINRDITNEVKLEAQLRQAQKMEAIGTLAGGIAHDFNNILGVIIGFTEMALHEGSDESLKRRMKQVLKASDRAKNLVNQILTISRRSEQEKKPIDINVIVKEAVKFLRSSIPSTINISANIPTVSATVLADPTQLHQILMNLCTNASHAMRETGGVMKISLEKVDIDSTSLSPNPGLKPGRYILLIVSDTGHGIDPSIMDRIFDPFFTTKKVGEGTGLGLSVVYGIVKSYGGEINVYSEPGKGTTFKVFLPRLENTEAAEIYTAESIAGGSERILFIDDEEVLVEISQAIIQSLGYDVTGRTSSVEALNAFRANPSLFDLIITDMTMPNMTGVELAREIHRIKSDTPIILCTGFSELINEEEAAILGIQKLLMKPLFIKDLAMTIREVLNRKNNNCPKNSSPNIGL